MPSAATAPLLMTSALAAAAAALSPERCGAPLTAGVKSAAQRRTVQLRSWPAKGQDKRPFPVVSHVMQLSKVAI
jgi:hypothetical protein